MHPVRAGMQPCPLSGMTPRPACNISTLMIPEEHCIPALASPALLKPRGSASCTHSCAWAGLHRVRFVLSQKVMLRAIWFGSSLLFLRLRGQRVLPAQAAERGEQDQRCGGQQGGHGASQEASDVARVGAHADVRKAPRHRVAVRQDDACASLALSETTSTHLRSPALYHICPQEAIPDSFLCSIHFLIGL